MRYSGDRSLPQGWFLPELEQPIEEVQLHGAAVDIQGRCSCWACFEGKDMKDRSLVMDSMTLHSLLLPSNKRAMHFQMMSRH